MRVLIVARTRMHGGHRCIGGITETKQPVRLLRATGEHPDASSPARVGDVWELVFEKVDNVVPPHVENVRVLEARRVDRVAHLDHHLRAFVRPWRGSIAKLFDGLVRFTANGNGYVCRRVGVPDHSTGFWIPDRDLVLRSDGRHLDYHHPNLNDLVRGLAYVGERKPPPRIAAGTLVRISLATWWKPEEAEDFEERCYLQLSEWYGSDNANPNGRSR
ncbi:MAG: hypothetical protein D6696_14915 [Acidobacteria bacterium]|nr:MAG: hypothetical protein D6696_14915 [Acidobacteriota bacterium]